MDLIVFCKCEGIHNGLHKSIFEKEVIEKKAQRTFQDTYAAIISNDVHNALFNLGSFSAYVGLLGIDYRADSRYYVLANLILDKFDINMDAANSIQH